MADEPVDRAAELRHRKSLDDGTCAICGGPRVICSPYGRLCCYFDEIVARGEIT